VPNRHGSEPAWRELLLRQHVLTPKPVARAVSAGYAACAAMRRMGAPRSHLHPRGGAAGLARDGSRGSSPSSLRTCNVGGANQLSSATEQPE
jgi:hypothetical protein